MSDPIITIMCWYWIICVHINRHVIIRKIPKQHGIINDDQILIHESVILMNKRSDSYIRRYKEKSMVCYSSMQAPVRGECRKESCSVFVRLFFPQRAKSSSYYRLIAVCWWRHWHSEVRLILTGVKNPFLKSKQPKNAQMLLSKANAVEIEPDCAALPRLSPLDEILPSSFRFTSHVRLVNSR